MTDKGKWTAAAEAGIRRVEKYYAQDQMFARYREVYEGALGPIAGKGDA